MIQIIKNKKYYFSALVIMLFIAIYFLINYSKTETLLWVNSHYFALGDLLFPYITYIGDGLFLIAIVAVIMVLNKKEGIVLLSIFIIPSLIAQIIKRIILPNELRPYKLIGPENLHIISGVEMSTTNSFPSGHSTLAFAFAFYFMVKTSKIYLQYIYLFIAILVAYSRMYLAQHFLLDITFGAIIGSFFGIISFYLSQKYILKK